MGELNRTSAILRDMLNSEFNSVHINDKKLSLEQFINFVCENPVKIFGIQDKGFIKEGFDADFTIVDMNKKITIKNENIESKCAWSPFDGYEFKGTPVSTIIAGQIKMRDGKIAEEQDFMDNLEFMQQLGIIPR